MEVNENVKLNWANVQKAIGLQADFLDQQPIRMVDEWEETLAVIGEWPERLYFTGCGDSFYCGLAAELAAMQWTGVETWALEALDLSRYRARYTSTPKSTWVVGVSNSGRVSRTIEALKQARRQGMRTFAVTYRPESDLAQNADHVVPYRYADPGFGPGTLSYTASLASLLSFSLALGHATGQMTQERTNAMVERVRALGGAIPGIVAESQRAAEQVLEALLPPWPYVCVVGGGPNYATALFGMAKMIESARHSTVSQQLEEWAHEQYFCTGPGTLTVLILPPGQSHDRGLEQLQAIRDVGGGAVVIAAETDDKARHLADVFVPMPSTTVAEEALTPLTYGIPMQVIATHYALATGSTMLGFDDPNRMEVNFRQIFGSQLADDE